MNRHDVFAIAVGASIGAIVGILLALALYACVGMFP